MENKLIVPWADMPTDYRRLAKHVWRALGISSTPKLVEETAQRQVYKDEAGNRVVVGDIHHNPSICTPDVFADVWMAGSPQNGDPDPDYVVRPVQRTTLNRAHAVEFIIS